MKKIDELIQRYKQVATSYYDDIVMIELDKINQLYDKFQETTEDMFASEMMEAFLKIIDTQKKRILALDSVNFDEIDVNKVVESFYKIIKTQRELICYLEQESVQDFENDCDHDEDSLYTDSNLFPVEETSFGHGFISCQPVTATESISEEFSDDKQLQTAFTSYCLKSGKSSYTANDYCSRIKNLWKNFYNEYKEGKTEDHFKPNEEIINPDSPLLNVYHHADMLYKYIMVKIDETDGNRNWTNARAAFNKFDKFRCSIEK